MICHRHVLILFLWVLNNIYLNTIQVHGISTTCGNKQVNETSAPLQDGKQLFEIFIRHSVLDPYLDIIPNITYTVIIQQTTPGLEVLGSTITIQGDDLQTTGSHDRTTVDQQTGILLSNFTSHPELHCSDPSEVKWTPRNFKKCFRISAYVETNELIIYFISTRVCRVTGRRVYYSADTYGYIESPGFPAVYPDNFSISYIIFSTTTSSIYVQSFYLEPSYRGTCFDSVTVISEQTYILCGAIENEALNNLHYHSENSTLTVNFTTDNKLGRSGFKLIYFSFETDECNKTLTSHSGSITSIGYPGTYFPRMYCIISIELPPEYRIQMTIKDIDIRSNINRTCSSDGLKIFSGNVKESYCGKLSEFKENELVFMSSYSTVEVVFTSNFFNEGKGYWIEFDSHIPCSNKTFTNSSGSFFSDNFPKFYSNNLDCFYTIDVSETNAVIEVIFESFHTESFENKFLRGDLCNLDYIEMYIGDEVKRICGQWKGTGNSLNFRSESGVIGIRFVTNELRSWSGFYATWQTVSKNSSTQCSSTWIEANQFWFEIVRNPLTWNESQYDCRQKGGFLATINDLETQQMLESFLYKRDNCTMQLDAFWIGANDILIENNFMWADGQPMDFNFWFSGWKDQNYQNNQPSDDGFSGEDCVEMRSTFHKICKGLHQVSHYYWNDRQCTIRNPYICQIRKTGEIMHTTTWPTFSNNQVYRLDTNSTEVTISSPGFPLQYPTSTQINYTISVPFGFHVSISFLHFAIEDSERCKYDSLTIKSSLGTDEGIKFCGNWNEKLKKLNWISDIDKIKIIFSSDKSIAKTGFSFIASIYSETRCNHKYAMFSKKPSPECILPFFQRVSLDDARDHCLDHNASLFSNVSSISVYLLWYRFLSYGFSNNNTLLLWKEVSKESLSNESLCEFHQIYSQNGPVSNVIHLSCSVSAYYVCSWSDAVIQNGKSIMVFKSQNGSVSMLKNVDHMYDNDIIVQYIFAAPKFYRILLTIHFLTLEYQLNCAYDYLLLEGFGNTTFLCGNMTQNLPLYFTSLSDNASLTFQSDSSILGAGFKFSWSFIDNLQCFQRISNGKIDVIELFNFKQPFADFRQCCSELSTPKGSRIIIYIDYAKMTSSKSCIIIIYSINGHSRHFCGQDIFEGTIVSSSNVIKLCLNSQQLFVNDGFNASYKIDYSEVATLHSKFLLKPNSTGELLSPHYPDSAPRNIYQVAELITPVGYYLTMNVTNSFVCDNNETFSSHLSIVDTTLDEDNYLELYNQKCNDSLWGEYIIVQSHLNKLKVVFSVGKDRGYEVTSLFHATYAVHEDSQYLLKTELFPNVPFVNCSQSSCLNGGSCVETGGNENICVCLPHFTGMFCQVSWCNLSVCNNNGRCILDNHGYICVCRYNYWGANCEMSSNECASTICSGNGVCIKDLISGKTCSCNKDWEGRNCSTKVQPIVGVKSDKTLMDEPIWIGMIAVLILLLLFGILMLTRRRCSRYFKCCEDTDQILKKQAENAIPAHQNFIPSSEGTPTSSTAFRFRYDNDATSYFLKVENCVEPIQTPPIGIENINAAARLFDAYKNKSERPERTSATSGIVDGKLQFLQHDVEIISSDNEFHEKGLMPLQLQQSELRRSFSSLPRSQKERSLKFIKTNSLHADVERETHCYPHIVIVNDSSNESLSNLTNNAKEIASQENAESFQPIVRERRKSIQRQKTFDDCDAQKKREVFATKSKSSGTRLDLPPFESQFGIRRVTSSQDGGTRRSPSLTPTSFDSEPTFKNKRRFRLRSGPESSDDETVYRHMGRSFSSQPDRLHEAYGGCKCFEYRGNSRLGQSSNPRYMRTSRKRSRRHHKKSTYSDRSSSCEKVHHRRHNSRISDLNKNSLCKMESLSKYTLSVPNQCTEPAKKVSMHIMEENKRSDEYYKLPVRKSRSNDLSINTSGRSNPKSDTMLRKRSHSFSSEMNESRKSQHDPDDLLNDDQKSTTCFFLEQDNSVQESEGPKTIEMSITDPAVVSTSSALSVTDTDTGFSSSSPWRETIDDLTTEKYKNNMNKDSAYQTKQSSVDHHRYDGPNNSCENPEDYLTNEQDMTKRLQQAVKRLALFEKSSQFSKDSAFTTTFSEAEDTASCDSEKSPREIHPPLRQRTSNFSLYPKHFPLEQVSEEGDSHTPESITITNDDQVTRCSISEEIEMQEFVV